MALHGSDFDPLAPFSDGELELELDLPKARPEPAAATTREREPEDLDGPTPRAVELADWDEVRPSVFLEGPYAIGVLLRNRALRAKLPELTRLRDQAAKDLDEATLTLGRELHDQREHPRAAELGTPLRIARTRARQLDEHEAELVDARAEAEETIAKREALIARSEEKARPLRVRAREIQAEIVVYQRDYEAVAKVIHEAAQELAALGKGADADRRIELEARRTNQKVEADAALAEIDARTPELTALEEQVAEHEKLIAKAEKAITAARAKLDAVEARVAKESADARAAFEEALRELADEAVRQRLDHPIAPTAAKRARLRHNTWAAHERELRAHEVALTLHHATAVRRGIVALVLAAVGLVAGLLYVVVP